MAGDRLDTYELLEKLGGGGMGVVFRARHIVLKKEFALKVLSPRLRFDSAATQRFQREAEALGRLEHAHLVRASDAGVAEGLPFLVMDLLDGVDLAQLTARRGRWPVPNACEAVRQAALGLQHAHERGLVHRDLKPSNLLLTRSGLIKVLDLGLARLCVEPATEALTQPGEWIGTPDYIAPEQIVDCHSADIRSDLYSLGCTLFHLLVGVPPFGDANHPTIRRKHEAHLTEPAPDLCALRPDVPAELAAVLRRLLNKRPEDRFATPAEVATALEPFVGGARLTEWFESVGAAPGPRSPAVCRGTTLSATRAPWHANRRLRWAVAGILLIAGGLGLAVWRWPHGAPNPSSRGGQPSDGRLTIEAPRVRRFRDAGANHENLGVLGVQTFLTHRRDLLEVRAELPENVYAYLLAFNPTNKAEDAIQLCWPDDEHSPPPPRQLLIYPPDDKRFRLDDGVGLQLFALVASRQPLPSYAAWRRQAGAPPWKNTPATSGFVWRGDGRRLERLVADGDDRGEVVAWKEVARLKELGRWLAQTPGVEAVALTAFAVNP
jgi:tRNA A-37 threonylcarbamoyl transferase component Bud32